MKKRNLWVWGQCLRLVVKGEGLKGETLAERHSRIGERTGKSFVGQVRSKEGSGPVLRLRLKTSQGGKMLDGGPCPRKTRAEVRLSLAYGQIFNCRLEPTGGGSCW